MTEMHRGEPEKAQEVDRASRVQRILRTIFPEAKPADTDYEYAFPLSIYRGPAATSEQGLRAYQRLRYGRVVSPELVPENEED